MFAFNMFHEPMRPFNTLYRCYSVSMLPGNERQDVEGGGKIIMPPSALDTLTHLNIVYPMLFKLTNHKTNRITHCGVLEFVADEGKVYLPYWMMRNLLLEEGGLLLVESVSLPTATFSKFQPQTEEFLDITNPKAVLENALRLFACLTTGDIIAIKYNDKIYELCVLETQPGRAVSIIECDMNVEFDAPVGYRQPSRKSHMEIPSQETSLAASSDTSFAAVEKIFQAFTGHGKRLDSKTKGTEEVAQSSNSTIKRGILDYDYNPGTLRFIRALRPTQSAEGEASSRTESFLPFTGSGKSLRA